MIRATLTVTAALLLLPQLASASLTSGHARAEVVETGSDGLTTFYLPSLDTGVSPFDNPKFFCSEMGYRGEFNVAVLGIKRDFIGCTNGHKPSTLTFQDQNSLGRDQTIVAEQVIKNDDGTVFYYHPRLQLNGTRVLTTDSAQGLCVTLGHKTLVSQNDERYYGLDNAVRISQQGATQQALVPQADVSWKVGSVLCSNQTQEQVLNPSLYDVYVDNVLASSDQIIQDKDMTTAFGEGATIIHPKFEINGKKRKLSVHLPRQAGQGEDIELGQKDLDGACRAFGYRFGNWALSDPYHGVTDLAVISHSGGAGALRPWSSYGRGDKYVNRFISVLHCSNEREGEPMSARRMLEEFLAQL